MAGLLADEKALAYDIIALQEPWRNPLQYTTYHPVKDRFDLTYQETASTRVCFFINRKLQGSWRHIHHSPDFSTVSLRLQEGARTIHIHNVYNPSPLPRCPYGTMPLLAQVLQQYEDHEEHIVLGDFNLHHPHWGGVDHREANREADELLSIAEAIHLQLLLPPGTRTRQEHGHHMTIDLVFATPLIADSVITCGLAEEELDHDSDHLAISTIIGVNTFTRPAPNRRQWQRLDEKKFIQTVTEKLPELQSIKDTEELDELTINVAAAIIEAIEQAVPIAKVCPRSIPGWTSEIKEVQMEARRLRRQYQALRTAESWEAYRQARNKKSRLIRKVLRQAHRRRIEEASESISGLWKLARWAKNRENRQAYTPPLRDRDGGLIADPPKKVQLLREAFFPQPPEADLSNLKGYEYPEPVRLPPITLWEIERAIRKASPNKASGKDGIPVKALQVAARLLLPALTAIFNAALDWGYYPAHFKKSITVVLRKPGKEDYSQVKSYRPVALLNTIGKIFDTVLAQRISYVTETYQLLPPTHLGGRKGSSTEHAIHLLIERIKTGWNNSSRDGATSVLCLDVSGAFDYVSHPRLLHNLRKRRIDSKTANCIESFLKDRETSIRLNEYSSAPMNTDTGIPQGSPMSPILYLFYNADLLDRCEDVRLQTTAIGYIDDVSIIVTSETVEENCRKLEASYVRCQDWERKHASKFNPTKYSLIHIPKQWNQSYSQYSVQLPGSDPIMPTDHARLLGIILDSKLSWNQHIQHIQASAARSLAALSYLAGSTWGVGYRGLRQIYNATIIPQLLYGCSAWYAPRAEESKHRVVQVGKLATIQYRAARIITGAYRATSGPALDVEAFLMPVRLRLEATVANSYMRIAASQLYTSIQYVRQTSTRQGMDEDWRNFRQLWTPLEKHRDRCRSKLGHEIVDNMEKRTPCPTAPWWKAPAVTIQENGEKATEIHNTILTRSSDLLIAYTDGSGINRKIGAAAVIPQTNTTRQAFMGTDASSTVYAAELEGIRMALEVAIGADQESGIIFADSQPALKAIRNPGNSSGQYIVIQIIQHIDELRERGKRIDFHWIPAHQGIEGNEAADKAAKEATGWRRVRGRDGKIKEIDTGRTAPRPARLECLHAAARQTIRKSVWQEWEEIWKSEGRGRDLFRIIPRPSKGVLNLHQGLSKPLSSILVQMRTGRIGLRHYLYSRNVPGIEDDRCECGQGSQTVAHVLLSCRRHAQLRDQLWREEDKDGRKRRISTTSLKEILNTPKYATKAAKFLIATGLLGQFRSRNSTDQAEQ